MPNHKSAMKRVRQNEKQRVRNRNVKQPMRTAVKAVRAAIERGDAEGAQAALPLAVKLIQRAASKGVLHNKTASRRMGRLVKAVNGMGAAADPKAAKAS